VPLRALAKDKETRDMRETEHGHKVRIPAHFQACSEDQYAYEYRDGVTSYGAFTYFVTKNMFDLGMNAEAHAGTEVHFSRSGDQRRRSDEPYYNQQPQLVGPKAWRKAEVPWKRRGVQDLLAARSADSGSLAVRGGP